MERGVINLARAKVEYTAPLLQSRQVQVSCLIVMKWCDLSTVEHILAVYQTSQHYLTDPGQGPGGLAVCYGSSISRNYQVLITH